MAEATSRYSHWVGKDKKVNGRYLCPFLGNRPIGSRATVHPHTQHSPYVFHRAVKCLGDQVGRYIPRTDEFDPDSRWSDRPLSLLETVGYASSSLSEMASPEALNEATFKYLSKLGEGSYVKKKMCSTSKPISRADAAKYIQMVSTVSPGQKADSVVEGQLPYLQRIARQEDLRQAIKDDRDIKKLKKDYAKGSIEPRKYNGLVTKDFPNSGGASTLELVVTHIQDIELVDALLHCRIPPDHITKAEKEARRMGDYFLASKLRLAYNKLTAPEGSSDIGIYIYVDSEEGIDFRDDGSIKLAIVDAEYNLYQAITAEEAQNYTFGMIVQKEKAGGPGSNFFVGRPIKSYPIHIPTFPAEDMVHSFAPGGVPEGKPPNRVLAEAYCQSTYGQKNQPSNPIDKEATKYKKYVDRAVATGESLIRAALHSCAGAGVSLLAGESPASVTFTLVAGGAAGGLQGTERFPDDQNCRLYRVGGMVLGGIAGAHLGQPILGIMVGSLVGTLFSKADTIKGAQRLFKDQEGILYTCFLVEGILYMVSLPYLQEALALAGFSYSVIALSREIQKGNLKESVITALITGGGLALVGHKTDAKVASAVAARVLPVMAYNGWSVRPLLQTIPNALHGVGAAMAYIFKGGASNNLLNKTTETFAENGSEPSGEDHHAIDDDDDDDEGLHEESITENTSARRKRKKKRRDSGAEWDIENTESHLISKKRRR